MQSVLRLVVRQAETHFEEYKGTIDDTVCAGERTTDPGDASR